MDSSLKQTTFSELQTRHLKLGKISSSTKECQKSSADSSNSALDISWAALL